MSNTKSKPHFYICLQNAGSEDLIVGKVYQSLPDEVVTAEGLLRIIDESGEDYLYPSKYFAVITLPQVAEKALFTSSSVSAD